MPLRIMCHGRHTLRIAREFGWLPGARYTNLRDLREFKDIGLIDIDWKNYDFQRHLDAVRRTRPRITIARDVSKASDLDNTLAQAAELARWAQKVVIVPKDRKLGPRLASIVPESFLLGYSVPTKYGRTDIPLAWFDGRPVHLLGGRPDRQYELSKILNVFSVDGNRITLDAQYGDYFVGDRFVRHPVGGYHACIRASLRVANGLWASAERVEYRSATRIDVPSIKALADAHRLELGFVLRPVILASADAHSVIVALSKGEVIGFVRFHHRRDGITTIYEVCVDATRRMQGIGRRLVDVLRSKAKTLGHSSMKLKCPEGVAANEFYACIGMTHTSIEKGRRRRLMVWRQAL
jgi:N-acetylglutamate synthase-like GNAT family acetyltransferase